MDWEPMGEMGISAGFENNKMNTQQITLSDNTNLVRITNSYGREERIYDDGYGPLWIVRSPLHTYGIVRAETWEDAYSIAEDELFDDCDLTMEEIVAEYGFKREHVKIIKDASGVERDALPTDYPFDVTGCSFVRWETRETPDPEAWGENELFCEAYGFRPNGARSGSSNPVSFIYSKDLNGESLDPLTHELAKELGLTIETSTNE